MISVKIEGEFIIVAGVRLRPYLADELAMVLEVAAADQADPEAQMAVRSTAMSIRNCCWHLVGHEVGQGQADEPIRFRLAE